MVICLRRSRAEKPEPLTRRDCTARFTQEAPPSHFPSYLGTHQQFDLAECMAAFTRHSEGTLSSLPSTALTPVAKPRPLWIWWEQSDDSCASFPPALA